MGTSSQNRYKSIVCEKGVYFTELVRYIHLNPVRAKLADERVLGGEEFVATIFKGLGTGSGWNSEGISPTHGQEFDMPPAL